MSPIIISLDGNIGAGKSTLLNELRNRIKNIHYVDEPVGQWTALKNSEGKNLLELFYEDKKRWAYTFQNCAILTRLKNIKDALNNIKNSSQDIDILLTERSVLTDRYVFAEMLRDSGDIDPLEWDLYETWFNTFANELPIKGILYLSTSPETSKKRIGIRNRHGEENIDIEYLNSLDIQHKKWVSNTDIPSLIISTEEGVSLDENINRIIEFVEYLKTINN
jgi:deoxyadenosine/deoxycytidine kinase